MNLHLVTNNPVYIDHFIKEASRLSNSKNYYVFLGSSENNIIKNKNIHSLNSKQVIRLIKDNGVKKLFIHYLDNQALNILIRYKIKIPVYWIFWGGDGYRHPKLKNNIYLNKTKSLRKDLIPRNNLQKLLDFYRERVLIFKLNLAFSKVNYCCNQVIGDYHLIKSVSSKIKMKHKWFSYNFVNFKVSDDSFIKPPKDELIILLGNSANPSNNHLEAMDLLIPFKEKIHKIYCPLSYSGSPEYINVIINTGHKVFGDKFIPLLELLEPEQYKEFLKKIDVGIFYHKRQQAFSNILALLQNNKKVLMNSQSTLFEMYLKMNVKNVFSNLEILLDTETVNNSEILIEFLGKKNVENWYKTLLE